MLDRIYSERPLQRDKHRKEGNKLDNIEYHRLASKYLSTVYKAAVNCCGNRDDADDAVQNTFLKLLKTDMVFESDEHAKRWLIRVAVNECKTMFRSFGRKKVSSIEELDTEPSYTDDHSGEELFTLLAKLPQNYRAVIHLYYYEGLTVTEIAETLGISQTNVQTRLMRARKKLEKIMKEEAWI